MIPENRSLARLANEFADLHPLVKRELLTAQRRPSTYQLRMIGGGGSMAMTIWALVVMSGWTSGAKVGHNLLIILASITFATALLSGLILTADSISRERRDGTLGLLFLTDLRGADVIVGKLVGKGLMPLFVLLAMFPCLSVCVIIGGVTPGEFWRLFIVLGNTLFFSLSMTLFTSLCCIYERKAYLMAAAALLLTSIGIPLLGWYASKIFHIQFFQTIAFALSPVGTFLFALDTAYNTSPLNFWSSITLIHVFSWFCLLICCSKIERVWSDRSEGNTETSQPDFEHKIDRIKQKAAALLETEPVVWLGCRHTAEFTQYKWLLYIAGLSGLAAVLSPAKSFLFGGSVALFALIHIWFKISMAVHTSYFFAQDRQSGALELLLGTPLKNFEIAKGLRGALRLQFGYPALILIVIDLLVAALLLPKQPSISVIVAIHALMFLFDAYCICWIGVWRGLLSKTPALAVLSTLGTILVLPWVWVGISKGIFLQSSPSEFLMLGVILSFANNAAFMLKAKEGFTDHFRSIALRPYGAKIRPPESRWSFINWDESNDADPQETAGVS